MKYLKCKKLLAVFAAAALFVSAGAGIFPAAGGTFPALAVSAAGETTQLGKLSVTVSAGAKSYNIGSHNYNWSGREINTWNWADTAQSALAANADGTFTRAECIGESVTVETYTAAFALQSSRTIALELPIYGGVFFGAKYNFIVCGQENPDYSDDVEVVRVIKYDKSWKRLGSASFRGKNTYIPFEAGTVSMDESGGKLFIHTSHKMYASDDGLNHQANLTFFVNEESMTSVYENYRVWNISSGYVSHSFNQVIRTDGNYVYTADHGDAYPRAIVLVKRELSGTALKNSNILAFKGSTGANVTKATLGDMQLSDSSVLTVGVSVRQDDNYDSNTQRNVFLSVASKSDISSSSLIWLTSYAEGAGWTIANPYIVKSASDRFTVLWEEHNGETSRLKCAVVSGSGSRLGIYTFTEGAAEGLSDCAPIVAGGKIVWYSTGSRTDSWWNQQDAAPVFYQLPADLSSVTTLSITQQPKSVTVNSGDSVTFTVKASGTGLQYQWYYKKKGQSAWSKWGTRTTASTTATSNDTWDGMQVRCEVTDALGNAVNSNAATITVNAALKITAQPKSVTVSAGESVTFTVKASGTGLQYQWYYKKKGQSAWSKWGTRTTASTTAASNDTWDGMQVYCKVTDSKGNSVNSSAATVTLSQALKILTQPQSKTIVLGESLTISVKASGTGLKYQWYFMKKGQTAWSAWNGRTHASETVTPNATWDGIKLRCKVTDGAGQSLYSTAAAVTLTQEFKIITQPADVVVKAGDTAKFTVKASGTGLKYQWYFRKSGCSSSWTLWNGHTTATTTATANDTWDNMQVYCKVTDASGKTLNSNTALVTIMTVKELHLSPGTQLTLKNTASGDEFTYQWYYKKKGQTAWSKWNGHNTPELKVTSNDTWDGMMIHCAIIGSGGRDINRTYYQVTLE